MAQYHLLQNKENDEEVADRSSTSTKPVNPKMSKYISVLAFFICGCVFAIVCLLGGKRALSNGTSLAGDLSFLSMLLGKAFAMKIGTD